MKHPMPRSRSTSFGVLLTALALGACGGGGSPSEASSLPGADADGMPGGLSGAPIDGNASDEEPMPTSGENFKPLQGVFSVVYRTADAGARVSFSGGFVRSDTPPFGHETFRVRDVCDPLFVSEAADGTRTAAAGPVIIGAGESLTVSGPGGTLANVPRAGSFIYEDYFADDVAIDIVGARGLLLDIPGGEYPAWSGVPIPGGTGPSGMDPALTARISPDSALRWRPSEDDRAHVGIGATFVFGDTRYALNCFGPDDGEFVIPPDLQAELGDATSEGWSIDRRIFVDHEQDTASLEIQLYLAP